MLGTLLRRTRIIKWDITNFEDGTIPSKWSLSGATFVVSSTYKDTGSYGIYASWSYGSIGGHITQTLDTVAGYMFIAAGGQYDISQVVMNVKINDSLVSGSIYCIEDNNSAGFISGAGYSITNNFKHYRVPIPSGVGTKIEISIFSQFNPGAGWIDNITIPVP